MALDTSAVTKQRGFSRFKKTSSPKGLTVNGKKSDGKRDILGNLYLPQLIPAIHDFFAPEQMMIVAPMAKRIEMATMTHIC